MDSEIDLILTEAQMTVLLENHELIDALFALTETTAYKSAFGDLPMSTALRRLEFTLADLDDDEEHPDPVLRERYLRMQAEMESADPTVLLKKLHESASFWDEELDQ